MLDNLTTHDIEMMDKVLQSDYSNSIQGLTWDIYQTAKFYKTTKENILFAYQNIAEYIEAEQLPICKYQKFPSGRIILFDFNQILYERYLNDGGFKTYFERRLFKNPIALNPPIDEHKKTINNILVGIFVTVAGGLFLYWILFHLMGEKP